MRALVICGRCRHVHKISGSNEISWLSKIGLAFTLRLSLIKRVPCYAADASALTACIRTTTHLYKSDVLPDLRSEAMPAILQRLARDPNLYKVLRLNMTLCIPKNMLAPDLVMAIAFGHGAQNYVIRPPLSDHLNPPPCVGDHVWRALTLPLG